MTASDDSTPVETFKTIDSMGRPVTIHGRKAHDEEAGHIWVIHTTDGRFAVVDRSQWSTPPVSRVYDSLDEFAEACNEDNWPMVNAVRAKLADDPPAS